MGQGAPQYIRQLLTAIKEEINRYKNKQMGPNETSKLLHSKGNHKQDEKTTLRTGENICQRSN